MLLLGTVFLLGVILLLLSTNFTIASAEKLSRVFKISPLIIATTVVAIGTSLPELVISLSAIATGDRNLALGNIVGSNVINIFLILPVAILLGKIRIGTTKTQANALILSVITALFIIFQLSSFPNIVSGFIFLIGAAVISIIEYKMGLFGKTHEDLKLFKNIRKESYSIRDIGMLSISLIGIITGGIIVVFAIQGISLETGLSTTVLGLSLTAIATSLPELGVTISSREKKREKIALGNILGSNMYNLLLVAGLINIFSQSHVLVNLEWVSLSVSTIILVAIIRFYKGRTVPNYIALGLLFGFFVYMWSIF